MPYSLSFIFIYYNYNITKLNRNINERFRNSTFITPFLNYSPYITIF